MERVLEDDDTGPAGRRACDLDRVLDGLCARVDENRALLAAAGRELPEPPANLDVRLIGADDDALVQVALGLLLDGLDDRWVPVAQVLTANSSCEVDERATVDVGDSRSLCLRDDEAWGRDSWRDVSCTVRRNSLRLGALPHGHVGDYAPTQAGFQCVRGRTTRLRGVLPLPSEYAGVAQLVEQRTCKAWVVGSSPSSGSRAKSGVRLQPDPGVSVRAFAVRVNSEPGSEAEA